VSEHLESPALVKLQQLKRRWIDRAAADDLVMPLDPSFIATGSGSYAFSLLDMREDVAFYLFFGGIDKPAVQAKSVTISTILPCGRLICAMQVGHHQLQGTQRSTSWHARFDWYEDLNGSPQQQWTRTHVACNRAVLQVTQRKCA